MKTGDAVLDLILGDDEPADFTTSIESPVGNFFRDAEFGKIEPTSELDKAQWSDPLGSAAPSKRDTKLTKAVRGETKIIDGDTWVFSYDAKNELIDGRVVFCAE